MDKLLYLKKKEVPVILATGSTILGIPQEELGDEYVEEFDRLMTHFESFLQRDVHTLLWMVNLRFLAFILTGRMKPLTKLNEGQQLKLLKKFYQSKIGVLRTSFVTLKAICGWSFYSLEKCWDEVGYLGHTIGREHETPTLLFGKEPWRESP